MGELLQDLHQMHDFIRLGAPFNKDVHVCVCLLNLHASALKVPAGHLPFDTLNAHISYIGGDENHELGNTSAHNEPESFISLRPQTCSRREITLLQLTLIRKLCTKVQSWDTGVTSRQQYLEILQTLLRQEKADSQLIVLLGSSDKLLSHLAAKCLSCLVLFLLKEENEVNSSWLLFCLKTMSEYPKSSAVSACIWSLTTVIKDLLDDPCLRSSGEFESFMSQLLEFLKSHLHSQHVHSCEWVSLVFIEQDDDMLEAAKSLLNLYVKSDRIWPRSINTPDNGKVFPNWTHDAGCNPHCIFLYLLKNVGFDATVLLDFLISTETCFLEYIVRYLKFLREDWTEFCQVCNFIDTFTSKDCATVCEVVTSFQQDCVRSQVDMGVSDGINSTEKAHFFSTDCSFQMPRTSVVAQQTLPCKSSSSTRTDHFCGLGTPRGLVDYDSSDDSEQDTASDPQQNCIRHQSSAGICNDLGAELDRLDLRSTSVNPKGSSRTSAHEDVADTTLESTMLKFTQCLAELQEAISRLKRRNLFPYNPSALLKLLMHIETLQGSKNPL